MRSLQFRFEILLWIFLDLIPFGVMFLVLRSLYQSADTIHSYTASQMIFYYFMVVLINSMSSTHFEGWRIEEIKNGKIDAYLLRPFSYIKEIVMNDFASRILTLFIFTPIYIGFYFLAQSILPFAIPTITLLTFLIFFGFILFAYCVEMCIALLIVLLGFWFEGSQGLEHFKWITISLFSGSMFPREFLPPWLQNVTNFLPFKYMYAVPINFIQGRLTLTFQDILFMTSTIVFLMMLVSFSWKKAVMRYTSSGG